MNNAIPEDLASIVKYFIILVPCEIKKRKFHPQLRANKPFNVILSNYLFVNITNLILWIYRTSKDIALKKCYKICARRY